MRKRVVLKIIKDGKIIGELNDGEVSVAEGYGIMVSTEPDPDDSWKRIQASILEKAGDAEPISLATHPHPWK